MYYCGFKTYMYKFQGVLGIIVFIGIAYIMSSSRSKVKWSIVIKAIVLQVFLSLLIAHVQVIYEFFQGVSLFFVKLYTFTKEGSLFLFGDLVDTDKMGWIFALQVLPSLIFFSALFSLLYYMRILPFIINRFSWFMRKTMGISGAESLAAAGNIFLGQSEAPLLIKPLLPNLTRSELFCLVVGGFATISGAILGSVSGMMGEGNVEVSSFYATHLLIASVLSAPAAIMIAKIMEPETMEITDKAFRLNHKQMNNTNFLDAIASGTIDGLRLALNVGAMLLVFVALIALLNYLLSSWIGEPLGINNAIGQLLSLEYILGIVFYPVAWLLGVPQVDLLEIARLIGEKTAINELYAFGSLKEMMSLGTLQNPKSALIASYALCGFANFSSLGIMIGGIAALAPTRRSEVAQLSMKALVGGTLASLITAAIAGIVL